MISKILFSVALVQLILVVMNFFNVPKTFKGFFFQYANFCTMFLTFICAAMSLGGN